MSDLINFIVDEDDIRIDLYLSNKTSYSRSNINKFIKESYVKVNGKNIKPSYKLKSGDKIEMSPFKEEEEEIVGENLNLDIIFEDGDIAVINKPRGMVVHPATGNYTGTLVNGLLNQLDSLSDYSGEDRPGIVHRLDKDTSGLIVVAKNNNSHKELMKMFKKREVRRFYRAIVHGNFPQDKLEGEINLPIARHPVHRQRMAVVKNGRNSLTYYKVVEEFEDFSLLDLELYTGRTHQIRVHMKHINHPILGDPVYSRSKTFNQKGQLLQSYKLVFNHPIKKDKIKIEIDPDEDMRKVLRKLRHSSNNLYS